MFYNAPPLFPLFGLEEISLNIDAVLGVRYEPRFAAGI
jgi:hypothetical protein